MKMRQADRSHPAHFVFEVATQSGSVRQNEMDEGAEGDAGGAFGEPGLGVVVPGGAGDVQVDPRRVAGELLDEHGAGDGAAAFYAADVLGVGYVSLDEFDVVVVDVHLQ